MNEEVIPFNVPPLAGSEEKYVLESMKSSRMSGDGQFTHRCHQWFEERIGCKKALLTPSCTHALEICAILINIGPGDEVIMPSYTFVSTANAFVLRGAKIVFVDVRPDTMNINENFIERAITDRTKAIVPVHYAGVSCEMDMIMDIASRYGLYVIEDAAQGMMGTYKGKALGTIGHFGTYSFHETKNYTSAGEGGLLIINDEKFIDRAEVVREKGTNRSQFFRGMIDKYSWVDVGSSYLMNDMSAAYLWGQLGKVDEINDNRRSAWSVYYRGLTSLQRKRVIELPVLPEGCEHNAHIFYLKVEDLNARTALLAFMRERGIMSAFHYIPLHSSLAGRRHGVFSGVDKYTTVDSERLIRLPMYYGLSQGDANNVITCIQDFFT